MSELSHNGKRRVYSVLLRVADVDGNVAPSERAILDRVVDAYEIGLDELPDLERLARGGEVRIGKSAVEQRALARGMVQIAAADGVLDPREAELLQRIAQAVGLPAASLDAAIESALERSRPPAQAASPTTRLPTGSHAHRSREGPVVRLNVLCEPDPQLPIKEVYRAAEAALLQTGRWVHVAWTFGPQKPSDDPTVEVALEPLEHPIFGPGHMVTVRLYEEGVEAASHSGGVIGGGDGLPGTVDQLVCALASPEDYTELMQERGVVGDLRHPDVKAHDPQHAYAFAQAACFNNQPQGLVNAAQGFLRVAAHTRDVEHLLYASELFAMAGELKQAEETLSGAEGYPPEPLRKRLAGLRCFQTLGTHGTLKLLLWLGSASCRGERPDLISKVLRHLNDASGEPLPAGPSLSSPKALIDSLSPVFGPLAAQLAFMGGMAWLTLEGHAQLPLEQLQLELSGLRPYLEPIVGPECYARLHRDVTSPEAHSILEDLLAHGSSYVVHHVR